MSNPIIERAAIDTVPGAPLTIKGVVNKAVFLLALTTISALGLFFYGMSAGFTQGNFYMPTMVGLGGGIITYLIMMFKPSTSKTLAIPYALFEGALIGGLAGIAMFIYPSVPLTALCATFITAAAMFALYRTGMIKVTSKLRSIITSATIAIMILYAVQLFLRFVLGTTLPLIFDGGMIAIGFSVFVIVVASFNLLLDFDNIETAAAHGVGNEYEWSLSVGLLATLVWMYIEFYRLLSYLED